MSWAQHTAGLLAAQARTLGDAIAQAEARGVEHPGAMAMARAEAAKAAALAGALKRYFFSLSEPE